MHDDPTRIMGQPEPGRPGDGRSPGNMRLLIAGLIAVIVGLVVAILVIASNDNGGEGSAGSSAITSESQPTETSAPSTQTTTESPSTSTEPSTGEETTAEPTTTSPSTAPEEEENGSGGLSAP